MLRMAICDGLTAWAVGLPLLATVGIIGAALLPVRRRSR